MPVKHIPVGLCCIATALKRAGYNVDIFDIDLYRYSDAEVISFLEKNNDYDIVGLGNIVSGYEYTKKMARYVKEAMPETILVVGNTVATSIPKRLLRWIPQIDIAVIGEGDETIVEIVSAKQKKRDWKRVDGIAFRDGENIIITKKRKGVSSLKELPFPDYSLFKAEKYISVSKNAIPEPRPPIPFNDLRGLPLNTARGCPFKCTFCNHAFKEYRYRYYPFKMVVGHIKLLQQIYKINYVFFWDELTFFTADRARELCDCIESAKVNFYWSINARANTFTAGDLDLLKRCRDLGALYISSAVESAEPSILKAMNKRIDIQKYIEQVQTAKRAGLNVVTSLVFGYPQETVDSIKKTIGLCKQLGVYPSAGFLLPLPETPVYEYAVKRGFIKNEEEYLLSINDRQNFHINLTSMPDETLCNTVNQELIGLKNGLGIAIKNEKVLKTGIFKTSKK